MGDKLSKGMGIGPVQYNAVDADAYRGFGFPGADEMGNMFQVYRDFEKEVLGARSADTARSLNPALQTFESVAGEEQGPRSADDCQYRYRSLFSTNGRTSAVQTRNPSASCAGRRQ